MIVALSVVAFVMVVLGLGFIVQGTPFTRLEWGWTMIIAGTITTTGGILLGGVAVVAASLRRVEALLARAVDEAAAPSAVLGAPPLPPTMPPPPTSPVELASAPMIDEDAKAVLAAGDILPAPADATLTPSAALLPAEEPMMSPDAPSPLTPTGPEAGPAAPAPPPAVVGTYASGGNRYVMYADGSIKADTPRGEFTFGSLAELKTFVAEGGEEEVKRPEGAPS